MNANRRRTVRGARTQALSALLLGLSVLPWGTGAATPVLADAAPDPAARLQVDITDTFIYKDNDWGEGEMTLKLKFVEQGPDGMFIDPPLAKLDFLLRADDKETVQVGRNLPGDSESGADGISADTGIPVYAGHRYAFVSEMIERDEYYNDKMGVIVAWVDESNNWGAGGIVTPRSTQEGTEGKAGDYNLRFEIKRAQLPDLRPGQIRVADVVNSTKKQVCTTVANDQDTPAGPFAVELRLDGSTTPAGTANATSLGARQSQDVCAEVALPVGPHKLVAMVDPARALPEMNEANNGVEQTFTVAPAATPTPTAQADLTISAVKVNGRVPDGKDDCKDGNNKVAVVVKNIGTANAGAFDVRLLVDPVEKMLESTLKQPAQPSDLVEAVTGLEAGKEIEVRFDGVRLKKGQHVLVAFADPKGTVAESKDDNNELRVTPTCKDDD